MDTEQSSTNKAAQLGTLAYAISDVGVWTWWAEQLPDFVQLEFGGAMLNFQSQQSDSPPSHKLALQFVRPASVAVLRTKDFTLAGGLS